MPAARATAPCVLRRAKSFDRRRLKETCSRAVSDIDRSWTSGERSAAANAALNLLGQTPAWTVAACPPQGDVDAKVMPAILQFILVNELLFLGIFQSNL